jgi:Ribose/xylose/arabinose/galactoside ABC-type transport systems, permease components
MAVSSHKSEVTNAGVSPRQLKDKFVTFISNYTVQIALILLIIVFSIASSDFLTPGNWINIMQQSSIIAISAIGMTFVIITSGIDLSVGSTVALSGLLSAQLIVQHGLSPWLAILVGLLSGVAIGLFNGFGVARLGVAAFIATLATMSMGRGLTLAISNGQTIFGLPQIYTIWGGGSVLGIPVPVIITLVLFVIAHLVLAHTVFGHQVYALGGNREAARLAGINVRRVELLVYVICGVMSALAGIILTGRLGAALPTAATGHELDVIAAIVIGGASLMGGRGNMIGTLFGVLTIAVLRNGLDLLNVNTFWVQFVQGAVIFAAVLIDAIGRRHRNTTA